MTKAIFKYGWFKQTYMINYDDRFGMFMVRRRNWYSLFYTLIGGSNTLDVAINLMTNNA